MKTQIKYLSAALLVIAVISAEAQIFSGGVIGGVSTGNVKITDMGEGFTDAIEGRNISGYEGGIFAKLQLGPFYAKPQLLYTVREGEIKYFQKPMGDQEGFERTDNFEMEKMEIPVLAGMNILSHFLSVEAGPVYNYVVIANNNFNRNEIQWTNSGFGYKAGVATELGPLLFHLSYQGLFNMSQSNKVTYKEPYKITFGAGLILGTTGR